MRGHCNRFRNIQYIYDNYLLKIKNPLLDNGHTIDCMFNIYNGDDEYFEKFKELYNPIKIFRAEPCKYQYLNFYYGMINIKPFVKDYDKIIFLRFDICYKVNITKWNILNDKGIFFPFKELPEFDGFNLVGECIIIIDNEYFNKLYEAYDDFMQYYEFNNKTLEYIPFPLYFADTLHQLLNLLLHKYKTFPVYYIIDGYYNSGTYGNYNLETSHRYFMKPELLNPLYIMMGRDYYGDINDYLLLERL